MKTVQNNSRSPLAFSWQRDTFNLGAGSLACCVSGHPVDVE